MYRQVFSVYMFLIHFYKFLLMKYIVKSLQNENQVAVKEFCVILRQCGDRNVLFIGQLLLGATLPNLR